MAIIDSRYRGFRVTRGDGTGEQLALLVPTGYRVLHFASAADEGTDWNVANPTDPTLYIHSETTPATDYLSIAHDGTSANITVAGGYIALAGGDVSLGAAVGIIRGSATQSTTSDGDGATDLVPEAQFIGVNSVADGSMLIANYATANTAAVAPHLVLLKGGAATQVSTTAVADNEILGIIGFAGTDGTDAESYAAAIYGVVDDVSGPTTGEMGGSLEFYTTADGGETLTLAMTMTSSQNTVIGSGNGLGVGSATFNTISDGDGATNLIPEVQLHGVGTAFAGGALQIATYNATNTRAVSPKLALVKGAAATQVATTAVADNEVIGSIIAYGSDGADFETPVGAIEFVVDDVGAPGAGAIGGSLEFYTTADGGETLTLAMTMTSAQDTVIGSGNGLSIGSATFNTISNGDGATNLIPEVQLHGVGAAFAGGALQIATYNTTNDRTVSPKLAFLKGAAATQVATSALADNEVVGSIIAYGSDSADFETPVGAIEFVVDDSGGPGAGAIGGSLEFYTTADGGETLTLALTIGSNQLMTVSGGLRFGAGANRFGLGAAEAVTIATGVATVTKPYVSLSGEGAADDQLDSITWTGVAAGDILILTRGANTITVDDANIDLGAATRVLSATGHYLGLIYDGAGWGELFYVQGDNA